MRVLSCILRQNYLQRCYCTVKATSAAKSKVSAAPAVNVNNATGLSSKCVGNQEPVGPGAARNAEYKVPEYFNYNKTSYFEAEVEMAKYRCPQPDAGRK